MICSTKIFCRDAKGAQRYWYYEVDGGQWRGHSGHCAEGSSDVVSGWSQAKPKNVGKKNARTAEEQASFEAEAEFRKKLDREYRRTPEELDEVPPAPMLAQKYKDLKGGLRFHPGGYINTQPKLDGIRMLASKRGGFSREYQQFSTVDHILEALAPVFEVYPHAVFDGELYNHTFKDDFNSISSLVRKENVSDDERATLRSVLQYHVYDLPKFADEPGVRFTGRQVLLDIIAEKFDFWCSPIVIVPTHKCDTLEDLDVRYGEYLADGYEGQMIRTNELYEHTRSWTLMKRKETITEEYPVIRLINGEGNWDGIPKAIEYMLPGDRRNEKNERPKASIKGTMEYCKALAERNPKLATIKYFALTPAGIPRFPVAIDFHDEVRRD